MKKFFLLLAAMVGIGLSGSAQNILMAETIETDAIGVMAGTEKAEITLKADTTLNLIVRREAIEGTNFEFYADTVGPEVTYIVYLQIYPANYGKRYLVLGAPNFFDITIDLPELTMRERRAFRVSDANGPVGRGCYIEHRQKALDYKSTRAYNDARNEFLLAAQCVECIDENKIENVANILICDSLIVWTAKADEYYRLNMLYEAAGLYSKIQNLNDADYYAKSRLEDCVNRFNSQCDRLMEDIRFAEKQRDWTQMQRTIDLDTLYNCEQYSESYRSSLNRYRNEIKQYEIRKRDHPNVFTYEWRKDVPIGIHYGTYNKHKVGGFIQLDLNTTLFDVMRSELKYQDPNVEKVKYGEANLAAGWTLKVAGPVWVHFTPVGGTVKFYYGRYEEKNYPYYKNCELDENMYKGGETQEKAEKHMNVAVAWSPVVGITAKYSYFALRVSYQYRFAIQKGLKEFIEPHRVSIGVGVAF